MAPAVAKVKPDPGAFAPTSTFGLIIGGLGRYCGNETKFRQRPRTRRLMTASGQPPATPELGEPPRAVRPALRRAAFALYWEGLWPRLALALALAGTLYALAALEVLSRLPDFVRLPVVVALALASLAATVRAALTPWPQRRAAIARLEAGGQLPHRPLTSLLDTPASGADGPVAIALWQAHQRRLGAAAARLKAAPPSPRLDRRDPYALRAAVYLAVIVAVVAARHDPWAPLVRAFRLPMVQQTAGRLDVWVSPPAYTGAAPRALAAAPSATDEAALPASVPVGSRLTIRAAGFSSPGARFIADDGTATVLAPARQGPTDDPVTAFETTVGPSGQLVVTRGDRPVASYAIAAVADAPPTIALTEEPGATPKGALHLAYAVGDDYRVVAARAHFEPIAGTAAARPLASLPEPPLALPGKTEGTAITVADLSAHPLAGARVRLVLEADDDAGQHGRSEPIDIILPARPFAKPLAAALAEQRLRLSEDGRRAGAIANTIDTLSGLLADDLDHVAPMIGLRVLSQSLRHARSDDDLRAAADLMWSMALAIEGGDASDAEERLRQARAELRQALQNGASPEEIARLTEQLRAALGAYLQALARTAANNPSRLSDLTRPAGPSQTVTAGDLDRLLDRLKDLSELGNGEAAKNLLSELDNLLDNLKFGNGDGQDGGKSPADAALDKLADLIRRQLDLMNDTHRLTPDGRTGPEGEADEQSLRDLGARQRSLADALKALRDSLHQQGLDPGDPLGDAGSAMHEAEGQLGDGDAETALGEQGKAVEALRQGARAIARASEGAGAAGRTVGRGATDPLGRPMRQSGSDSGDTTTLPGEIDAQRARRLLEELRRRYSDPNRPPLELDYLQRLIAPFTAR